jgi:hypothetical protein
MYCGIACGIAEACSCGWGWRAGWGQRGRGGTGEGEGDVPLPTASGRRPWSWRGEVKDGVERDVDAKDVVHVALAGFACRVPHCRRVSVPVAGDVMSILSQRRLRRISGEEASRRASRPSRSVHRVRALDRSRGLGGVVRTPCRLGDADSSPTRSAAADFRSNLCQRHCLEHSVARSASECTQTRARVLRRAANAGREWRPLSRRHWSCTRRAE